MITLFILEIIEPLEAQINRNNPKNSLINRFCMATLKSKIDIRRKENFDEISHFTCECFFKKYKSGSSIKNSRIYCKDKASEKYDL
tara:strand:- start:339 stop:596 length:258 start_codon:yes stop_codon:yes gene_type:complete